MKERPGRCRGNVDMDDLLRGEEKTAPQWNRIGRNIVGNDGGRTGGLLT